MVDLNLNGIDDELENQSTRWKPDLSNFDLFAQKNYPITQQPQQQPAPVAPAPAPTTSLGLIQAMPETQKQTTFDKDTATKQILKTAKEPELEAKQQQLFKDQSNLMKQQLDVQTQINDVNAEQAKQNQAAEQVYQSDYNQLQNEAKQEYDTLYGELQNQRQIFSQMKVRDFWQDKTVGDKIIAGLAIAMGAYGSALSGGKNYAYDMIQSTIEQDHKKQLAQIELQKNVVQEARQMTQDAKNKFDFATAQLLNKKAMAYQVAKTEAEAKAAQLQNPQAKANAQVLINQLDQKANEAALDAERAVRTIVENRTSSKIAEIPTNKQELLIKAKMQQEDNAAKTEQKKLELELEKSKEKSKLGEEISKEYRNHPVTKQTNEISAYQKRMETAYKAIPTSKAPAVEDTALVFGYMKMLDPTSVVREGEQETIRKTAAIPDYLINLVAERGIGKGGTLTQEQRDQIIAASRSQLNGQMEKQQEIYDQYTGIRQQGGGMGERPTTTAPKSNKQSSGFPRTVTKGNQTATVSNQQELDEAKSEGWK